MKKSLTALLTILVMLLTSACGQHEIASEDAFDSNINATSTAPFVSLDSHIFLTKQIENLEITYPISNAWIDDGKIYIHYRDDDVNLFVVSYSLEDGGIKRRKILNNEENDFAGWDVFYQDYGEFVFRESDFQNISHLSSTARLNDGTLLAVTQSSDNLQVLREINESNFSWGETEYPITIPYVWDIFTAQDDMPYDILIDNGVHVFGYELESGYSVTILNWLEAGLVRSALEFVTFIDDKNLFVISQTSGLNGDGMLTYTVSAFILTPMPRELYPARKTITMGGLWFDQNIMREIIAFNQESRTHYIEIYDYSLYDTALNSDGGLFRFQMDIISGGGPDIIYGVDDNMIDAGVLLDLYRFIDSDPELSRTDFFPNILKALEDNRAQLPAIANNFAITTMLGRYDVVSHIDYWTASELFNLIEEHSVPYPMGTLIFGTRFIDQVFSTFIDWDNSQAWFDSSEFIDILEATKRLPDFSEEWQNAFTNEYEKMMLGEQLLSQTVFWSIKDFQVYLAALDDIIVLGIPTENGGVNQVLFHDSGSPIGINAATSNADDAWQFIRAMLLPGSHTEGGFPLRIDIFEYLISEAKDVVYGIDENGNEIVLPSFIHDFVSPHIEVFAMTDTEAAMLREVVYSAKSSGQSSVIANNIAHEELPLFLSGARSAEDTARIIQNRVQTYLNERG